MAKFFADSLRHFCLLGDPQPGWRTPQLGAIGAIVAHWTLYGSEPGVLSLPTGSGKTAVALSAPFLLQRPPTRILVVVPSVPLRQQMVGHFASQELLARIRAFSPPPVVEGELPLCPNVIQLRGRPESWASILDYDVVVSLPNSISPVHFPEGVRPPPDLFDLIIVDEAHHAPAETWKAILDHFAHVPSVLLTATPIRRDKKPLPGRLVYHYPVRRALAEGIFQPVEARLLSMPASLHKVDADAQIAEEAIRLFRAPEHTNSVLMVRAGSIQRVKELRALYEARGLSLEVLHNRVAMRQQEAIIERLRSGEARTVAVVGMLGEGFDLPSLRIVAYHDKHKSLPATVQLIGRLARVDDAFPQRSVLITVRDNDVFPELKGIVRALYEEDADWAAVLPGVIDDEIRTIVRDREFAESFAVETTSISPAWLHPLRRSVVLEVTDASWEPPFSKETLPEELKEGSRFGRGLIRFSGVSDDRHTVVLVVEATEQPKWSSEPSLAARGFELHLMSFRRPARTDLPSFVFINSGGATIKYLVELLGLTNVGAVLDPDRTSKYLDSLERQGVSSVGVKTTAAANRGTTAYKNFMGSQVDRGLRASDTAGAALGHAMLQFKDGTQSSTAGASTRKGKLWVTRYASLREYDEWIADTAARLWFDFGAPTGPLLPNVNRGHRLTAWPGALAVAAELHPALAGQSWNVRTNGGVEGALEDVELHVASDPTNQVDLPGSAVDGRLEFIAVLNDRARNTQDVVWHGYMDTSGQVRPRSDATEIEVQRGFSEPRALSQLLTDFPPTVYFLDGTTTIGPVVYQNRRSSFSFPPDRTDALVWQGVDITAEIRATAEKRGTGLLSIAEHFEAYLVNLGKVGRRRWVICNDGAGEIADYLVLELLHSGEVRLCLWHAKASGGVPSVRIKDMQVVIAQALRSRRWFTDSRLWAELCARLVGESSPRATLVTGSDDLKRLLVYLGYDPRGSGHRRHSWRRRSPVILPHVGVVQPGLSKSELTAELAKGAQANASAAGVQELLELFADTTTADGRTGVVLVSP